LVEYVVAIKETRNGYRIFCLCKLLGRPEGYVRIKSTIILRKELAGTGRIASNVVCLL
jgi:hypothetical protein